MCYQRSCTNLWKWISNIFVWKETKCLQNVNQKSSPISTVTQHIVLYFYVTSSVWCLSNKQLRQWWTRMDNTFPHYNDGYKKQCRWNSVTLFLSVIKSMNFLVKETLLLFLLSLLLLLSTSGGRVFLQNSAFFVHGWVLYSLRLQKHFVRTHWVGNKDRSAEGRIVTSDKA